MGAGCSEVENWRSRVVTGDADRRLLSPRGDRVILHGKIDVRVGANRDGGRGVRENTKVGRADEPLNAVDHKIGRPNVKHCNRQVLGSSGARVAELQPVLRVYRNDRAARLREVKYTTAKRGSAQHPGSLVDCQIGDWNIRQMDVVEDSPARAINRTHDTKVVADVNRCRICSAIEGDRIDGNIHWWRDVAPRCSPDCCAKDVSRVGWSTKSYQGRVDNSRVVRVK